ncbi:hypothetical protein RN22_10180 [Grimontia sp. AD028]|uniref:hypothetical protein n=1 Tax=Grimontia sp. AD028 TaxID=1581149 RepID=UPI00061B341D|nr:hypothetical protein [Grimontia sp. AD028]KKD60544.1 hypothetical protein RN22_10180 [Grimontia sp. AD028]
MKKLIMALAVAALVSGCANKDFGEVVNDGVNGAIDGVLGSVGVGNGTVVKNSDGGFSVEKEEFYITDSSRTRKNYGSIGIASTKKNPNGRTEAFIETCVHPRIGSVECTAYLYEVTPEGWLVDDAIPVRTDNRSKGLAAGKYYFKVQSEGLGNKYIATGEATIVPFVTNYLSITLE